MVEVRFEVESAVPPEQVLAAATDFSERRLELWANIDPSRFRVHTVGAGSAEVTEGGREFGGIWARERYDWTTPGTVTARVMDSNVFAPGSRWELHVRPTPSGGSRVEWMSIHRPRGLKGRAVPTVLRFAGRRYLRGYLQQTLARLEDRIARERS